MRRALRNSRATESTQTYFPSRTQLPGQGEGHSLTRAYIAWSRLPCGAVHDAPRVRAFGQAFNLIDPARDTDSWNGLRATILDMVEAMDVSPPATEISTLESWNDAARCEIEQQLDAVVPGEIVSELGRGREALGRAHLLRKWRAVLLLRQAGLALGWLPFKGVMQSWLNEHQAALAGRPSGALRIGLNSLVFPGQAELNLAPFRPRTMHLGSTLPPNCVVASLPEAGH